ncbi:MAG: NBR1-Ig-like domain-containing protein [Anaerolineaceae bacterium]|nr:NBR1-Ig-like domain-containing protein [Anaerolineaceae bacterium]
MSKNRINVLVWILILFFVVACGFSFGDTGLSDEEKLQTAVAATVSAIQPTQVIPTQAEQPTQAQATAVPTNTQSGPATQTPVPCNSGLFISETVPDGTAYDVGESFDKTWRLKNVGTCTWNSNYQIVFADGDKMGGPTSKNLSASVAPGESVDLGVSLIAPNTAGTYKGYWKVKDDQGAYFVNNLWVEIKAKSILGPPPVGKPDLVIGEFSINPAIPIWHDNTHVRVRAKNQGIADSGGFKMDWYGLTTAANPSCTWNIAGGLVAGGSVLMECDYMFGSWYPVNKTSIVYIDTNNTVDESNESNNTKTISPFGVVTPTP